MRVHANDGISAQARAEPCRKRDSRSPPTTFRRTAERYLNKDEAVDVLLVRSATKVRRDLIDACPGMKLIGRGGVGLDNIDVVLCAQARRHPGDQHPGLKQHQRRRAGDGAPLQPDALAAQEQPAHAEAKVRRSSRS
jgi:hypothetical protein